MIENIRTILGKIKFELKQNPYIEKSNNNLIPSPYKSIVLFSADFELAWAWRFSKNINDSVKQAIKKASLARKNIPDLLNLCDKYNVPITWATVGHLFLEDCSKINHKKHPEISRTNYFENTYWKYNKGDWFDLDPCTNYKKDSSWYAPDIIKDILARKVKHEIACHTFSHIDCSDQLCNKKVFDSEIIACKNAAEKYEIKLETFIHPGHTIGNLESLSMSGFKSFRTDYSNILGNPHLHKNGLWELKNTMELEWRKNWSKQYHIYRFKKILNWAIKKNKVAVFWFHPSMNPKFVHEVLPEIFTFIEKNKKNICALTTKDYIKFLNGNHK